MDETEGTVLFHAISTVINALKYQVNAYAQMDFPDDIVIGVGKSKSALQWHLSQLVALREKMIALKQ